MDSAQHQPSVDLEPAVREPSLRERKKRRTRATIAEAAAKLFVARGFEAVTVEEIARAADVSRQTVFNYFASKEEMLFDRDAEVLRMVLARIRERPPGSSPVDAFRAHTRAFWERRAPPGATLTAGQWWSVVQSSPALRDRAEVTYAQLARAVAVELALERGLPADDPGCHAVARMLCGVNTAILACGLGRLSRGEDAATVSAEMLVQAERAYDLLEHGLGT